MAGPDPIVYTQDAGQEPRSIDDVYEGVDTPQDPAIGRGQQRWSLSKQAVTYDDGLPRYDPMADAERAGSQVADLSGRGVAYPDSAAGANIVAETNTPVVGNDWDDDLTLALPWSMGAPFVRDSDIDQPKVQPGQQAV